MKVTAKPLKPDLKKFNPVNGFKRIFSKAFMERVLGAVKVLIPTVAEYGDPDEKALETFREEKKVRYFAGYIGWQDGQKN